MQESDFYWVYIKIPVRYILCIYIIQSNLALFIFFYFVYIKIPVRYELHQAKRGLMVIKKKIVRYISAFNYYEGIYIFIDFALIPLKIKCCIYIIQSILAIINRCGVLEMTRLHSVKDCKSCQGWGNLHNFVVEFSRNGTCNASIMWSSQTCYVNFKKQYIFITITIIFFHFKGIL